MIAYRSISLRPTAWFSFVLRGGLVFFGAVMWLDLKVTLTSGPSKTLERSAVRLGDLLREMQSDLPGERDRKFLAAADATGGRLIEVLDADGQPPLHSPSAGQAFP